jgi:hypothetical protein
MEAKAVVWEFEAGLGYIAITCLTSRGKIQYTLRV